MQKYISFPQSDFQRNITTGRHLPYQLSYLAFGWAPEHDFETGLESTLRWYLDNREWCDRVSSGAYQRERLGLGGSEQTGARP